MILVTGSTGFVGTPLCNVLKKDGYAVREITRDKSQINGKNIIFIKSIDSQTNWSEALEGVDTIIHLAARVHVMNEASINPLEDYREVNTFGSFRLAEAAIKRGVKKFIYISTIKVNGEVTVKPFTENSIPNPTDPYGLSKFEAENMLRSLCKESSMDLIILRPSLIYGPKVKGNLLRIMSVISRKIPLPFGCVNNKRTMLYLENLIDLIIFIVRKKEKINDTFLVADQDSISTKSLVESFASVLNPKQILIPVPLFLLKLLGRLINKSEEIQRLTGNLEIDTRYLNQKLGWTPKYSTHQGLVETAESYKNV